MTTNVFDAMGVYWAEIADKNQTEKQFQFLTNNLKLCGFILDLACGTGRHSIPLSQLGNDIVGLDISINLLKIAKQRWQKIMVIRGDMRFLPFKPQAFGAAISMDTSFGYLPSEKDDQLSLTELGKTLEQNGIVVIDVFNREQLMQKFQLEKSTPLEYPSFFLRQKRTVNPNGQWLCDLWIVCDKASGRRVTFEHVVRLYEFNNLQSLIEKAGFTVERVCGGYQGENLSSNSSRLILIAIKK